MTSDADPWRNAIVSSKQVDPNTLTANPLNWRTHPENQLEALEGLISTVGWVDRILVNKRTGHVVDGHARLELAVKRGEPKVPVDFIDVDEEAEKLILATFDPISMMAQANTVLLEELVVQCDVDLSELVDRFLPSGDWDSDMSMDDVEGKDVDFSTTAKIIIILKNPDDKEDLVAAIMRAVKRQGVEATIQ